MLKLKLKELLPELSEEARKNRDPETKKRLYLVKTVVTSNKNVKNACESIGASRSLFYKCAKLLLKHRRISALKPISRKPKKSPRMIKPSLKKKICIMRNMYPFYGPRRISFYLNKLLEVFCHHSTIFKVLKREGLVTKEHKKKRTKKHMKRYRRPFPGYLQMDIKYVPYHIEEEQNYQISVVDHCSSWRLIRGYEGKDLFALKKFLKVLDTECPFKIYQIQTDNDATFTDKYTSRSWDQTPTGMHFFDEWCEKRGIEHKLIPIGEKELNGKVENTHKFDDEEFYSQHDFQNFWDFEKTIKRYNIEWNENRHTETLSWKTPSEVVLNAHIFSTAYIMHILKTLFDIDISKLEINAAGFYVPHAKHVKKQSDMKKAKKIRGVARYLAWMDWDENKKFVILFPVSSMSVSFSPTKCPLLISLEFLISFDLELYRSIYLSTFR